MAKFTTFIALSLFTLLLVVVLVKNTYSKELGMPPTVAKNAQLVEIYSGDRFFEGPTWEPRSGTLYFTAFGKDNQQILRLERPGKVSVWLDQSEGVNGTFLSNRGTLLGAQGKGHRVMEYTFGDSGPLKSNVLYHNPKLNQPNDICQTVQGDIFFTDPDFKERKNSAVYHLATDGKATKIITDMPLPNGILTSKDGKTLYISDSHLKLWRSYPILNNGRVGAGKVFFNPNVENRNDPDGMTRDIEGNLYFTGRGGVWGVRSNGQALGFIPTPEFCSNVIFGGQDGRTLYVTCDKKVYSLQMRVAGSQALRAGEG
ncbi:MAG: SMP-30/gluconolactonase/LRE family protein [Cyanobacteriota bacterium]